MKGGVRLHNLFVELCGRALQRAVFRDVCAENLGYAHLNIMVEEGEEVGCRLFFPSVYGNLSVTHVGPENNAFGAVTLKP